jgi:tetratricopeptide (TPR) repeat protein
MLVTDLSQSPDVEVLGTDRLVQILTSMKRQDDRVVSFDTVQEIAKRSGVTSVLLGSYVKAGETLRTNIKLQEATSGRIVSSERVEAEVESNLFAVIDDLTHRIKADSRGPPDRSNEGPHRSPRRIDAGGRRARPRLEGRDDDLVYEAYATRRGSQPARSASRGRSDSAARKAIAIDRASPWHWRNWRPRTATRTTRPVGGARQARVRAHRPDYSAGTSCVEGMYYGDVGDVRKAIDAYAKAVELFPDHASARHNLALQYDRLERFQESIPMYEDLRRRGMTATSLYTNLAEDYQVLGEFDKADKVLQDYLQRNPDNAEGFLALGMLRAAQGRLDDALATLAKAEALARQPRAAERTPWHLRCARTVGRR